MATHGITSRNAFDNVLRRRTEEALAARQQKFPELHRNDTDEQLLDYLRSCAKQIGHSPNACEVIGGAYLLARFGSWDSALRQAGLGRPGQAPDFQRRWIYRQEREHQLELHRVKKRQKALEKQKRLEQKKVVEP